jgi:Tol biopolymer transport system component
MGRRLPPIRESRIARLATIAFAAIVAVQAPLSAQREPVLKQIAVPHPYYFREMYLPQLTSGPSSAAWSPDGTELVYSMGGSLWRQRLGTTVAAELPHGQGYAYQPDWSSDGRFLAYSHYHSDRIDLEVLELATGRIETLVQNGAVNVEPRWSPDGGRVAFVSTAFEGRWHVFTVGVGNGRATSAPTRITADDDSHLPRYYYSNFSHFLSPSWSPDGRELLLVSNVGRIMGSGGFWRMEARAGAVPRLVYYEETTWKARPDWARDGKRVVYSSYAGRQWNQLWLTTADGGDPIQLTYGDFDNTAPRWSPDGRRIAFVSNQGGNTSLHVIALPGGATEAVTATTRRYADPRTALAIAVVDPSGRPTPARVSVTGPTGRGYVPDDVWAHADDGFDRTERSFEVTYFHTRGASRLALPPGRFVIEATKGLEYARVVDTVTVGSVPVTRRLTLHRLIDLPASGWFSGDLHIHMNYGGTYRNTPANLRAQAEAEDLHVAENLVVNKEQRIPDVAYFSGTMDPVSTNTTLIKHDEEYHTSYWGHSGHLGLTRQFLLPNYAGYVNTAAASLFPHNSALFDQTHAQGGITGYVHPFESVPDFSGGQGTTHALPIDAALGKVDYLELCGFSDHRSTAAVWYRLLNTGVRLAAGAGTDAMANFASLRGSVGLCRVFAESGRLDYRPWLAAIKAGRTFATNGPLLGFTLDGKGIGSTIELPGSRRLTARVSLRSFVAVDSLQVVRNGEVIQSIPLSGDHTRADATVSLEADRSGWYLVRAFAPRSRHPVLDLYPYGTTSPIYLIVNGRPIRSPADARYFVTWLDQLAAQADAHTGWNDEAERRTVREDIARARAFFDERSR